MWVLNCCCFLNEQIFAQSKEKKSYLDNFKFQHFSGGGEAGTQTFVYQMEDSLPRKLARLG